MPFGGKEVDDAGGYDDSDGKDDIREDVDVCSFHIDIIVEFFFGVHLLVRGQAGKMDLVTQFAICKLEPIINGMVAASSS